MVGSLRPTVGKVNSKYLTTATTNGGTASKGGVADRIDLDSGDGLLKLPLEPEQFSQLNPSGEHRKR
jgi:hypothetical protein